MAMDKAPIDMRKLIGVKLLLRDLGPEVVPRLRIPYARNQKTDPGN
jgi:hypothetical protein